jgi:hypothetical protein
LKQLETYKQKIAELTKLAEESANLFNDTLIQKE